MTADRRRQPDRRTLLTTRPTNAGRRGADGVLYKIHCPYCHGLTSKVINSRPNSRNDGIFRRRECLTCEQRFSTEETIRGSYPPKSDPDESHRNI